MEVHERGHPPAVPADALSVSRPAPGQRDSDSLPPYDVLDPLLRQILEGETPAGATADPVLRERIERMLAKAEFKRRQAPPIIKVQPRSFGADRQMPIAAKHSTIQEVRAKPK